MPTDFMIAMVVADRSRLNDVLAEVLADGLLRIVVLQHA